MKHIARNEDQMMEVGAQIAQNLKSGDVLLLNGTLGMGKTVLSRGIIRTLMNQHDLEIPSPTFTLVQTYDAPNIPLYHFDLYRLEDPEEIFELGWEDAIADGITIVEWPERLGSYKPKNAIEIEITAPDDTTREILVKGIS